MPFTPFHLGAGLIAKAATGNNLSFISFGTAQIFMDIEPGIKIMMGAAQLHGWSHTIIGAILIALLTIPPSKFLANLVVKRWNAEFQYHRLFGMMIPTKTGWRSLTSGALFGTLSHVLLDSLIHTDLMPFAPFSTINPLLGLVQHDTVYAALSVCVVVGAICWLFRQILSAKAK